MRSIRGQAGLTLLEVLIALSIFATIGVTSYRMLGLAIDSEQTAQDHSLQLNQLQKTMSVLNRDLQFHANRAIRSGKQQLAGFIINEDYPLEFSRAAWRNPLQGERSQLQRVAYSIGPHPGKNDPKNAYYGSEQQFLLRHYWPHLDRHSDNDAITQVLFPGITDLKLTVISDKGRHQQWPQVSRKNESDAPELLGLLMEFNHQQLGAFERLYRLN